MSLAGLRGWIRGRAGPRRVGRMRRRHRRCARRATSTSARSWVAHAIGDLELSLGHPELAVEHFAQLDRAARSVSGSTMSISPRRLSSRTRCCGSGRRATRHAVAAGLPRSRREQGTAVGARACRSRRRTRGVGRRLRGLVRVGARAGTSRPSTGSRRHAPGSPSALACAARDGASMRGPLLRAALDDLRGARRVRVARSGRRRAHRDRRARAPRRRRTPSPTSPLRSCR